MQEEQAVNTTLKFMEEGKDRFALYRKRENLFSIVKANDYRKWDAIRGIYATVDTSHFTPYPVDWTCIFSPIESMAWGEIRNLGLPFFPQFPIGRFFADFADPVKKIVIECDGKAFHNKHQDELRDSFMGSIGWTVFRVSGADCNRIISDPWEDISCLDKELDAQEIAHIVSGWASKTVDGLIWSLGVIHYDHAADENLLDIARQVLLERS